jgi:hypothetical protein
MFDTVLKDAGINDPASRLQTRPPRRHPPRVPACRLTSPDDIFGNVKHEGRRRAGPGQAEPVIALDGATKSVNR